MASASSLWRLHHDEAENLSDVLDKPQNEAQAVDVAAPPREREHRRRGRFRIEREEPQAAYALDVGQVLSILSADAGPDSDDRLMLLRDRERSRRLEPTPPPTNADAAAAHIRRARA